VCVLFREVYVVGGVGVVFFLLFGKKIPRNIFVTGFEQRTEDKVNFSCTQTFFLSRTCF
jgi:hypothetical protein